MRVRKSMAVCASVSSALVATASSALAHPGHGLDASAVGLLHFLLEISHGGGLLLFAVVVSTLAVATRLARSRG